MDLSACASQTAAYHADVGHGGELDEDVSADGEQFFSQSEDIGGAFLYQEYLFPTFAASGWIEKDYVGAEILQQLLCGNSQHVVGFRSLSGCRDDSVIADCDVSSSENPEIVDGGIA